MNESDDLDAFLSDAFQTLGRGVADRRHPARHPTLATISPGGPQQRTVVMRGFDRLTGVIEVQTDGASAKIDELSADPRAALHVWVPRQQLQLRLSADVTQLHADNDRWAKIPKGARAVYGGTPPPGTAMASPQKFAERPDIERFSVLLCHLRRIELLHLGEHLHRRALFLRRDDRWLGQWIAP